MTTVVFQAPTLKPQTSLLPAGEKVAEGRMRGKVTDAASPMTDSKSTSPSSPCIRLCVIDPASGLCRGCLRTLAEIAAWSTLSEVRRLAIMAELSDRAARLQEPSP